MAEFIEFELDMLQKTIQSPDWKKTSRAQTRSWFDLLDCTLESQKNIKKRSAFQGN